MNDLGARVGERELDTESVVEEIEFFCLISEGLAEPGVFDPENLRDLRAIGRGLDEIYALRRAGLWAKSPATDTV